MIYRGPMTSALLTAIEMVGKPVGDAIAPSTGGWQGEPNAAGNNFIPYAVLTPGVAGQPTGPLSDPSEDWQLGYNLSSYGVSREQCEWMADRARSSLGVLRESIHALGPEDTLSNKYKVQKVGITTIGSIQRVDATNPPYWGQVDQLSVWVTKGE